MKEREREREEVGLSRMGQRVGQDTKGCNVGCTLERHRMTGARKRETERKREREAGIRMRRIPKEMCF